MAKRDRTQTLRWLREGTERRREKRGQRKRTLLFLVGGFLVMLVICLPSMLTYSPLVHNLIDSAAKEYGWSVRVKAVRIGWLTPLRLSGIDAIGPSGETIVVADSIDAPVSVLDLLRGKTEWGTINIDGPRIESTVYAGGSRLEDDLAPFMESSDTESTFTAKMKVRDAVVKISDADSGASWRTDQLQASVELTPLSTQVEFEGVITDPVGISGALTGAVQYANADGTLDLSLTSEGLPLSVFDLAVIRMPEIAGSLPQAWSGNATGKLTMSLKPDGGFQCLLDPIDLRNLIVQDPKITGDTAWKVGHALASGSATLEGSTLRFNQFSMDSDAGNVRANGIIDLRAVESAQYLDAMLGEFSTEFDLALLTQSAPGLIPVRGDVTIQGGRVKAEVKGDYGADKAFRSSWKLNTEPITAAMIGGQTIVLQPISADVVLRPSNNWISAEKLLVTSSFGEATASGDWRGGQASFDLDFERLAGMLRSVLDLPPASLGGVAKGSLKWSVSNDQIWKLEGSANATNLLVVLPGITTIERPQLEVVVAGEGVWGDGQLARLDRASVKLSERQQTWNISLLQPVLHPNAETLYPIGINGKGELQTLATLVGDAIPESVGYLQGMVEADVVCFVSQTRGSLSKADVIIRDASMVYDGQQYQQSLIKTQFVGNYQWPENILRAETLSCSGNAASFIAQGDFGPEVTSFEIAYRADLSRLRTMVVEPQPVLPNGRVEVTGGIEGTVQLQRHDNESLRLIVTTVCKDLQVAQASRQGVPQVLWREPTANLRGELLWNSQSQVLGIQQLTTDASWLNSTLTGQVAFSETGHEATLSGPAEINVSTVSDRLTTLLGEPIRMTGTHKTNLSIALLGNADSYEQINATGSIGWQSAQVSGVTAGPAEVPLRITEHTIMVEPATIPIENGLVNLAGTVHYQDQPLWFEQQPGTFAEGITLTSDMCRTWLKYMLPIAADTTDVTGAFSVDLAECKVVPSDPASSRVVGTLRVERAAVGPGPLTQTLITTINQLKTTGKGLQGPLAAAPTSNSQWVQLDPQAVDFSLLGGRVNHQRLQMRIDKASLISSGSVALDGRLNLRLQLPLESSWLGSDLAPLAGRELTLPVGGTLSRPALDTQAVAGILAQLGTQAIQSNAENFLQKQLDRQLQKLFGN